MWGRKCDAFFQMDHSWSMSALPPKADSRSPSRDTTPQIQSTACRDKMRARIPASSGLFATSREISVCTRLRGGAERTRTACQARSSVERVSNTSRLIIVWLEVRVLSAFAIERRFPSSLRIAPNWRGFVRAFCLCKLSIGFHVPFWRLCLCPAKSRFPTAETAVMVDKFRCGASAGMHLSAE
jgi:hypothetical protein